MDKLQKVIEKLEQSSTPSLLKGGDGYEIDTVRRFLDHLGRPQDAYKVIHVGGTAGKGSTAHFISSLLNAHGLKAGLFTSPHISSVKERIKVEDEIIGDEEFVDVVNFVLEKANEFKLRDEANDLRKLTYFELLLASALIYFRKVGVKVAVLEVGLGGTLDPTNVVDGDVVVLTNIGLDHTEILGDTIEKIARDKVGIVKKNCAVVSAFRQKSVVEILEERCREMGAEILLLGKEFDVAVTAQDIDGSQFSYLSGKIKIDDVEINIPGKHQVWNASLAIKAFTEFCRTSDSGIDPDIEKIRKALAETKIPGRIEIISKEPLIILDGAHNQDKIQALVDTLDEFSDKRKDIFLLFAFKKGQDSKRLISPLVKLKGRIKKVYLTKYKLKQDIELESEPVQNYIELMKKVLPDSEISFVPDAKKAYEMLVSELREYELEGKSGMLVVTGSFYLLASIL